MFFKLIVIHVEDECTKCKNSHILFNGEYFSNNQICMNIVVNCSNCHPLDNNQCSACNSNYVSSNNICQIVDSNCISCDNIHQTICLSCITNYSFYNIYVYQIIIFK